MRFPRSSGIILHPTSLPGKYGTGDLGAAAYSFIDWLAEAGQKVWQVLPLGPTGYGDSPYQLFSAFAGNPLLIDIEALAEEGWIDRKMLAKPPRFPADHADFGGAKAWKTPLLHEAAERFFANRTEDYEDFCLRNASWLDDYSLFVALKQENGGVAWNRWPAEFVRRDPKALDAACGRLSDRIRSEKFAQYVFFRQWFKLKEYAREHGIRIMGDLPIYVAHDSADVWANPELFYLDGNGGCTYIAGVPPDYFSATGQLWGNPIYRWDVLKRRGYGWWIERMRATLALVDMVRLDHFRGFEAFWQVPGGDETAINGTWEKGPGEGLFTTMEAALGELPLIAENLGVITPEVEALLERFRYPGMAVLQFAFGTDPQAGDFRPHNYPRNRVAYSGTHDNDTTIGWWTSAGAGASTRSPEDVEREREFTRQYLHTDGREMNWVFIRTLAASVADTVLFPIQDVLGLGTEARMNLPGSFGNNWKWRMRDGALTAEHAAGLKRLCELYDR